MLRASASAIDRGAAGKKGKKKGGGDLLDSADMTFLGASNPVGFRPPKR